MRTDDYWDGYYDGYRKAEKLAVLRTKQLEAQYWALVQTIADGRAFLPPAPIIIDSTNTQGPSQEVETGPEEP